MGARSSSCSGPSMTSVTSFLGLKFCGRFTVTAVLGEGAMGVVFRAVEEGRAQAVAIKILHPDVVDDASARTRFEREAEMAAQIDHPNAVRIFDHGVEHGVPYLVMELVEGQELFDVLAEAGRLAPARAAAIAIQICDAVATAHDRGIIHRDLKPENVMLVSDPTSTGGERVKLLDFGIARRIGSPRGEADTHITVAGAILGTPAYMSPEQCEGSTIDARSDVYACGAVLYHLVTGRPPFEDDSALRILFRHVHEEPLPPSVLVPDLDPGLEAIILKALAKDPESRQQGAHDLWEELLAALPHLSSTHTARPGFAPRRPLAGKPWRPTLSALSARARIQRSAPPPAPPPVHPVILPIAQAIVARRALRRRLPLIVGLAAVAGIALGLTGFMGSVRLAHTGAGAAAQSRLQAMSTGR